MAENAGQLRISMLVRSIYVPYTLPWPNLGHVNGIDFVAV